MLANYKRFEKCFFRADKTKDTITYTKLKYQFRSMLAFAIFGAVPTIYLLIVHHHFGIVAVALLFGVLAGFKVKAYQTIRLLFFTLMAAAPSRYPSTSLVLVIPATILISNMQTMILTQSDNLMIIHWLIQVFVFYFYGMDHIAKQIREMSHEELVESARTAIIYAIMVACLNMITLKLFYSQFSSLLRKVNTLKDTLSKANNQLNEQNIKLQNNLEMKDVFIYTFSHELKNALNGLLGNLYLAYDSAKISQVIQYLSSAKVCGEILKNFIHNILDSGKLEKGNLEVSPERKEVMSFMQNVWSICSRIIQNKRLKGSLEIERNVPRFLDLDEQRMIQIILNLVSNAVKFTEKGYVRLRVSWLMTSRSYAQKELPTRGNSNLLGNHVHSAAIVEEEADCYHDTEEFSDNVQASLSIREGHLMTERPKKFITDSQFYRLDLMKTHWNQEEVLSSTLSEQSKGILKIQVVDSGCGMTAEDQSRLFQKFSQVGQAPDQKKVGTGLGLWICKELAHRLGGDINTRSIVGNGSVFELTIQTQVSQTPKKSRNRQHSADRSGELKSFSELRTPNTMKILVADDDSFNIELMKNYLSKCGIDYICAYDGEEAVSLFKKYYKEIGFVITDNFMPKKLGTEAALEIACFLEGKGRSKIPIMCISGDLKVSIGEKGITSVIQKPINFDRLKEELMAVYPQLT